MGGLVGRGIRLRQGCLPLGRNPKQARQQRLRVRRGKDLLACRSTVAAGALASSHNIHQQLASRQQRIVGCHVCRRGDGWGAGGCTLARIPHQLLQHGRLAQGIQPQLPLLLLLLAAPGGGIHRVADVQQERHQEGGPFGWRQGLPLTAATAPGASVCPQRQHSGQQRAQAPRKGLGHLGAESAQAGGANMQC